MALAAGNFSCLCLSSTVICISWLLISDSNYVRQLTHGICKFEKLALKDVLSVLSCFHMLTRWSLIVCSQLFIVGNKVNIQCRAWCHDQKRSVKLVVVTLEFIWIHAHIKPPVIHHLSDSIPPEVVDALQQHATTDYSQYFSLQLVAGPQSFFLFLFLSARSALSITIHNVFSMVDWHFLEPPLTGRRLLQGLGDWSGSYMAGVYLNRLTWWQCA